MIEVDDSRQSREQMPKLTRGYGDVLTKDMYLVMTLEGMLRYMKSEEVVILLILYFLFSIGR